jgi:hypothetical protein
MIRNVLSIAMFAAVLFALGCGGDQGDSESAGDSAASQQEAAAPAVAEVPSGFFLAALPEAASDLAEVKVGASVGDEVVFAARIGGRVKPFTDESAVFLVADPVLPTCAELHGDSCKSPWDYCCEPKDDLLQKLATVQIVDSNGRPLRGTVRDLHGLVPMARVVVIGNVSLIDGPTFVVDASGIYVQQG